MPNFVGVSGPDVVHEGIATGSSNPEIDFLAALMVGRRPEYLGKKVEAREMKLAALALLVHPLMILVPAGIFAATDWGIKAESNPGAHGFSQVLYQLTSCSANNGSGFEGLGDTWGFNNPDDTRRRPRAESNAVTTNKSWAL